MTGILLMIWGALILVTATMSENWPWGLAIIVGFVLGLIAGMIGSRIDNGRR